MSTEPAALGLLDPWLETEEPAWADAIRDSETSSSMPDLAKGGAR